MLGQQIGNYRLVKLLGSGGFADVYLGQHVYIRGKQTAIKILHAHLSQEHQEGFLQEAEIIFRLKHPHIIPIIDFGIEGNSPYLIMEYISNGTLRDRHPKGSIVQIGTVVSYIKQIAEALQHAHDCNLIHRDLKPENLLVGDNGEIVLSDFGIATIAHNTVSMKVDTYTGTIQYSAPEQIKGKPRPASDQYALGVIAYEWIRGERPFGGDVLQLMYQHEYAPPPPLHEKVSTVSLAVEEVIIKALAKDPKQRFGSIQAFATSFEKACIASSKPIQPATTLLEKTHTVKPKSVQPGTTLYTYRGHSGAVQSVVWSPNSQHIASGSFDGVVQVWDAITGNQTLIYRGHSGAIYSVVWSPNGQYIASGSADKTVQVWDAATGNQRLVYRKHSDFVPSIAWSPDSKYIASGSWDKTVQVWDATNCNNRLTYRSHSDFVDSVAWSPDGKRIASGSNDNTVQMWQAIGPG